MEAPCLIRPDLITVRNRGRWLSASHASVAWPICPRVLAIRIEKILARNQEELVVAVVNG